MSKTRDALRYPIYQPRKWGEGTIGKPLPRPWWGLDTERNTERGNRYGDFVCGWVSNEKESKPFKTFRDLDAGTYWVWNIAYDIEGMVRDLALNEGWAMREDGTKFRLDDSDCVYYQGKRFQYSNESGKRIFLEASSFFNRIPLKEAAKTLCVCDCSGCVGHKKKPKEFQHCGEDESKCPMKDPVDASKMSLSRYERDRKYREIVDKYCAKDARIAYRLMVFLERGFKELGVDVGGTPGATARRFLTNIKPFPKVIWATQREFLKTYCGGRFELLKRGVFHGARQWDLISAYPWALAHCPMLTAAAYQRFTRRLSDDALYGAYEIGFKTDEYLGVIPGWKGSTRIYSRGEKRGWITRPELEWLAKRGHDYTIFRGVEIFDEAAHNGWRDLVLPLFNTKEGHTETCAARDGEACTCKKYWKGQPICLGAKVGVNSMYGILIQLIQKGGQWVPIDQAVNPVDFAGTLALEKGPRAYDAGQFYAPVYSATLTSMVRVRVLDAALELGESKAIGSHTDSMHGIGGNLKTGDKLGDWKLEEDNQDLIILKSGQYAIGDKVKGRGFSKRRLNPLDETEIPQRQKVDLWANTHTRKGRVGVKTTDDWKRVSLIEDRQVANNFAWEVKRKWDRDFSLRMIQRQEWIDSEALIDVGNSEDFGLELGSDGEAYL